MKRVIDTSGASKQAFDMGLGLNKMASLLGKIFPRTSCPAVLNSRFLIPTPRQERVCMENLAAIGFGLGLRALIDSYTYRSYVTSALVGLWEGVVLNHFLTKYPTSLEPYLAFAFRLFVDFIFTESLSRELITLLWTGLGFLLADVTLQVSSDYRFRRLWRSTTQKTPLRSSSRSLPPRVRFYEDPDSFSTDDSNSTVASPPVPVRPTTTPLPGRYDQWSEVTPSTATERSPVPSDFAPSVHEDDYSPSEVPLPRSPYDLEYVSLPVIPDSQSVNTGPPSRPPTGASYPTIPDDIADRFDRPPSPRSGLTTPRSEQAGLRGDDEDRPRVHSGLTTPENARSPLQLSTSGLPPQAFPAAPTDGKQPRLTLVDPSPIGLPEGITFPEPQPAIPPVSDIPNIPTPDEPQAAGKGLNTRTPPPSFQEAMRDATAPDELESLLDQESVISGAEKNAVVARADEIRKKAREQEKERDRIRQEWRKAERQGRFFDALRLELELEDAQATVDQMHAKAARRYYHGMLCMQLLLHCAYAHGMCL